MARQILLAFAEQQRQQSLLRIDRRRLRDASNPLQLPETEFIANFHLSKAGFQQVLEELRPYLSQTRRKTAVRNELKILAALNFFANGSYQRNVGASHLCNMSQPTFSKCLHEVTDALNVTEVFLKYVKFLSSRQEREIIMKAFMEKFIFPGIIGCFDGTHVALIRPVDHKEAYFNRKNYHSLNILIDINRLLSWSQDNKLSFNLAKCSVLSFSRARAPSQFEYAMDGSPINRITEVRDLGVHFECNLSFRQHITDVCKKAYRNLGVVLRQANNFTNIRALKALYEALVKSHLECNAVIWSPHEEKYKLMIERIQNKFLRFLYLKQYGVFPGYPLLYPSLFVLGMVGYYRLEVRREVALASYVFSVIRGKIHNPGILWTVQLCVPDEHLARRRRPPLLAVPRARTCLLQRAPLVRALRVLNTLSEQIDLFSCSLNEFTKAAYCLCST